MAIEGVDYAWSRPDIDQLAAAGKRFACRYGGAGSDGKQLHADEAAALSAAGVAIVANVEGSADGLLGGWSAGVSWARQAEEHFRACGMPPDRPIYLSVDFGVTSTQWPAVREALKGAASVIGAGRVGVYGGRWAIEWARRDGVAKWFWQTYAWSYGVWVPGNHIEQYKNGVSLAGATLDLDRALQSDYGQWTTGDDMADTELAQFAAWRQHTIIHNLPYVPDGAPAGLVGERNELHFALKALTEKVDAVSSPVLTDEQLAKIADMVAAKMPKPPSAEDVAAAMGRLEAAADKARADVLDGPDQAG